MKSIFTFSIVGLATLTAQAQSTQTSLQVREDILTKEESILLKALQEYDEEFLFTGKVRRYFATDAQGTEVLLRNEIIFDTQAGFIISNGQPTENVAYQVSFTRSNMGSLLVTYSYSAGTSFNVDATALVNSKGVVQNEYSCGTASCGFESLSSPKALAKRGR